MPTPDPHPTPGFDRADRRRIQGIVTSGFGHMVHTAYLFLRLHETGARAAAWLAEVLDRGLIMTAASWRPDERGPKIKPDFAVNIAFTHAGLAAWGVDDQTLRSFPPEFVDGPGSGKTAETMGDTGDSAPDKWEFGVGADEIHVVLMVHATTAGERERVLAGLHESFTRNHDPFTEVVEIQHGRHLRHIDPVSGARMIKEHFGFKDGISQPELRGLKQGSSARGAAGQNTCAAGEFILGYPDEYGFYPATPLTRRELDGAGNLPESPYRSKFPDHVDFGYNGSYLVYRKLAQNVGAFWRYLRGQCGQIFGREEPAAMLWLAAKMVGRWPNGVPLVEAPDLVDMTRFSGHENHFMFAKSDPEGSRCPFGAHVRRANPRDHLKPGTPKQSLRMSARHRLIRRGASYGEPLFNLSILDRPDDVAALELLRQLEDDGRERGLHFFCLNANIRRQFEFVQQSWCVSRTFNNLRDGPDPAIGGAGGEDDVFAIPGFPHSLRLRSLSRFTHTRAAAYLFLPGLDTLRHLTTLNCRHPRSRQRLRPGKT